MLGNSLTDAAEWTELLPGVDVVNRGLASDTVAGMLRRAGTVTKLHSERVFVMAGISDLQGTVPPATALINYRRLVVALRTGGARVTIASDPACRP